MSANASFAHNLGTVYKGFKQVQTFNGDALLSALGAQSLPPGAASEVILSTLTSGDPLTRAIELNRQFGGTFNPFLGAKAPRVGTAMTYNSTNGAVTGTWAFDNVAAVQRALYTANGNGYLTNSLFDARFGGLLFPNLPQGGISFSVGAEYRTEHPKAKGDPAQTPDLVNGNSDPLGFNAAVNSDFKRNTYSFYGEVAIPVIVQSMKVPGVKSLDFSAAIRYEPFENIGQDPSITDPITGAVTGPKLKIVGDNGSTPRFTMRYQPYDDLTLRASYGKSYVQPSFATLFLVNSQNFPVISDPLQARTLQPASGVFQRGNPDLLPEKSDTYTVGLDFTPKWFRGFTLTVDY